MSMLSAQIDKLRHEADMLRDHGTFIGYGGLTSTDPEMIECADLMCDAADTIWQLRDDLQRTNAENARLRELLTDSERHVLKILDDKAALRQQLADVTESMGRVEERCAKLRELIKHVISRYNDINREYWGNQEPLPCDLCNMERQCSEAPRRDRCLFYEHLRELGIEASK